MLRIVLSFFKVLRCSGTAFFYHARAFFCLAPILAPTLAPLARLHDAATEYLCAEADEKKHAQRLPAEREGMRPQRVRLRRAGEHRRRRVYVLTDVELVTLPMFEW